jgi:hypothetical protein
MRDVSVVSDYEFEFDVTRKATTTGTREAAAALTSVSAWFSLTNGGSALTGTTTTLTERSATAGRYFGILDAAAVSTALLAYVGRTVYEVFSVSGDVKCGEPLRVVAISDAS